ncbi:MAG: hypothetical protein HUJ54_06330 [Erysipelotrichaceae bacterium]|nr:hypothetical protein [Erysipelotrichaceae bacterium]
MTGQRKHLSVILWIAGIIGVLVMIVDACLDHASKPGAIIIVLCCAAAAAGNLSNKAKNK